MLLTITKYDYIASVKFSLRNDVAADSKTICQKASDTFEHHFGDFLRLNIDEQLDDSSMTLFYSTKADETVDVARHHGLNQQYRSLSPKPFNTKQLVDLALAGKIKPLA